MADGSGGEGFAGVDQAGCAGEVGFFRIPKIGFSFFEEFPVSGGEDLACAGADAALVGFDTPSEEWRSGRRDRVHGAFGAEVEGSGKVFRMERSGDGCDDGNGGQKLHGLEAGWNFLRKVP